MIDGYRLIRSLEPAHPLSTYSHDVHEAVEAATGARVAVKQLFLDFPLRPQSAAWFMEAVAALRQVRAPGVCPVGAAGFADGPWFAMAFFEGESLETALARGPFPNAIPLLRQVGAAWHAVRSAGISPSPSARHILVANDQIATTSHGVERWAMRARDLVQGQYTTIGHRRWFGDLTPSAARGAPSKAKDCAASLALLAFRLFTGRHYWNRAHEIATSDPHRGWMDYLVEVMGPIEPPQARTSIALPRGFDAWFTACLKGELADAAAASSALPIS